MNVGVDHAGRDNEPGRVDMQSRFAASGATDGNDAVAF